MLYKEYIKIKHITLHKTGNKSNQDGVVFSKKNLTFNDNVLNILKEYFLSAFKTDKYYHLAHSSDINLNEVYTYVSLIFGNPDLFYEQSINLTNYLYEQSTHPKIKGGEFYIVYFKDCIIDGNTVDAIGLFKSENKDTFLKIYPSKNGFEIESEKGVNINKLDKGCLIFNLEKDRGYLVEVVDNTNKSAEAKYWTEDFLHVVPRRDEYYQTENILSLCQNFVSQLPQHEGKAAKALLMNKGIEALKKPSINLQQFAQDVFTDPELIQDFNQYKDKFQEERKVELSDNFRVSTQALKKKGLGSITRIKLDQNFDINIHGGEQMIKRGYDQEKDLYYYQLFFKEEK